VCVAAIPGPDSALRVGEVLLVGRQLMLARPVKPVADVPYSVGVLGVSQWFRTQSPPVGQLALAVAAGPLRLIWRTRMPVGQSAEARSQALARPRRGALR
jgi:hypothetical protein